MKSGGQFVYTLLGYILILIALVCLALAIGASVSSMLSHRGRISHDSMLKWGGLTFNTLGLFCWVLKQYRRFWASGVFWAAIGSLLLIHIGAFFLILGSVEHWSLIWFLVICTVEVVPISAALEWTMAHPRK